MHFCISGGKKRDGEKLILEILEAVIFVVLKELKQRILVTGTISFLTLKKHLERVCVSETTYKENCTKMELTLESQRNNRS